MKAFGHVLATYDDEDSDAVELGEFAIQASPKKLRKLAAFLNECADYWDKGGDQDHIHFQRNTQPRPQVIALHKPKKIKS